MPLIIYQPVNADPKAFVDFWAARYSYPDQELYDANVGQELTETRILDLFTWKNGTPLSNAKRESVLRNFVARRAELNQVQQNETAANLLSRFSEGGAIWRIFWLHCWQPARFPIYDQHVHRAMRFIQQGVLEEIPVTNPQKIRVYLHSYMAFHTQFDCINFRIVDKALWAFGKFLKENNFPWEANGNTMEASRSKISRALGLDSLSTRGGLKNGSLATGRKERGLRGKEVEGN